MAVVTGGNKGIAQEGLTVVLAGFARRRAKTCGVSPARHLESRISDGVCRADPTDVWRVRHLGTSQSIPPTPSHSIQITPT